MSMGDKAYSGQRADDGFDAPLDDPFAELADLIDGPKSHSSPYGADASAGTERRGAPGEADEAFGAEFAEALNAEMAKASAAPGDGTFKQASRSARSDAEFDEELVSALTGLCDPVNPRNSGVQQSDAFAPARTEGPQDPENAGELDDFDALIASELAAMSHSVPAPAPEPVAQAVAAEHPAFRDDNAGFEGAEAFPADIPASRVDRARRPLARDGRKLAAAGISRPQGGMKLVASVAAIAVVGGLGYYLLTGASGVGSYGDVLVVQADKDPVKVPPTNPGGRSIPNQDQEVYARVQSADAEIKPSQKTLLSASTEPVDLPTESSSNDLPGVDLAAFGAARAAEMGQAPDAAPSAVATSTPVLKPRRVQTLTVRPDGTLVVENVEASDGEGARQAAPVPAMIAAASRPTSAPAPAPAEAETAVPAAGASDDMQVASIEPQAPATPESAQTAAAPDPNAYYVQISSQPSEEAAKTSSTRLGQRYAGVIGNRNVVIQSADIPGKGTYYRVRVATASRDEANTLCSNLKSAGGNCFVSR